jgi:diacylglycerol kinase (ATP)
MAVEPWLAIVNPVAGKGAGARLAGTLAASFAAVGLRVDVARSPGPGECARLAAAAVDDGYKVILSVGGDGTANEIANGMVGSTAVLALYPIGTGNDFARNLGYPRRRKRLAAFLAKATPREIDTGLANGRAFVNHASIGIGGVVAERARGFGHYVGPVLGYATSSLAAIASFRPVPMRVTVDGEQRDGRYLIVVASNGVRFGGGMRAAPKAKLDDGWFDVSLAGDLGRGAAVAALVRLYRGTHVDGVRVHGVLGREIDIELDRALPMEMDGEVARVRSLSIRMNPRALRVLA